MNEDATKYLQIPTQSRKASPDKTNMELIIPRFINNQ